VFSFVFLRISRLAAKAASMEGNLERESRCGGVEKPQRWMSEETALRGLSFFKNCVETDLCFHTRAKIYIM